MLPRTQIFPGMLLILSGVKHCPAAGIADHRMPRRESILFLEFGDVVQVFEATAAEGRDHR
jgi:hypothetical protein